jgi:hypothetical protein
MSYCAEVTEGAVSNLIEKCLELKSVEVLSLNRCREMQTDLVKGMSLNGL